WRALTRSTPSSAAGLLRPPDSATTHVHRTAGSYHSAPGGTRRGVAVAGGGPGRGGGGTGAASARGAGGPPRADARPRSGGRGGGGEGGVRVGGAGGVRPAPHRHLRAGWVGDGQPLLDPGDHLLGSSEVEDGVEHLAQGGQSLHRLAGLEPLAGVGDRARSLAV